MVRRGQLGSQTRNTQHHLDVVKMFLHFHEPPEEIAEHFVAWVQDVGTTLEAAGMTDELKIWNEALGPIPLKCRGWSCIHR